MSSIAKILTAPLFEPTITAPLLVAIVYFPKELQSILPAALRPWVTSPAVSKTLIALIGLGLARAVNNKLSSLVVNNWKSVKFVPSQEIVLVTGGSSGIGALIVKEFAEKGAKVVIMDVNAPAGELHPNVFFYRSDVTSTEKIAASAAEIRKEHGDPTVLINNAGIGSSLSILEGSETSIQRTFEINTISHFWMAREFLPAMIKKNHGHVVTVSSMAAYVTLSNNVDYSCTKASAVAFHEGLASELKNKYGAPGVRTTLVNPSWTKSPLTEALYTNAAFKGSVMETQFVSGAIVRQVLSGKSGHLVLPTNLGHMSSIRGWPSWMQYGLRNAAAHTLDLAGFSSEDKLMHLNRSRE